MKRFIILPVLLLLALVVLWGCDNDTSNDPVDPGAGDIPPEKSCLGCHSSEELLKAAIGDTSGSMVLLRAKDGG
ncbi:MAG: hypothetical protein ABFS42_10745 [Candidatus Krumholzibacteriota bacterium]